MKIENLFILGLLVIGVVFLIGFYRLLTKKSKQQVEVAGYQLKKGHLDFHVAFVKKYSGCTLAFFPLVEVLPLASFHSADERKAPAAFKGMACLLEVKGLDRELFHQLLKNFDRIEEHEQNSLTLYKEDIDFLTPEMLLFVEEVDRVLLLLLKESSPEVLP